MADGAAPADPTLPSSDGIADYILLHPHYRWQLALNALIFAIFMALTGAAASAALIRAMPDAADMILLLVWLPIGFVWALLLVLPHRRYRQWGYAMEPRRIRITRGYFVRIESEVPFSRVQHIDVLRGPTERLLGLATLMLHTAGGTGSIALPGLTPAVAEALRDNIRAAAPPLRFAAQPLPAASQTEAADSPA